MNEDDIVNFVLNPMKVTDLLSYTGVTNAGRSRQPTLEEFVAAAKECEDILAKHKADMTEQMGAFMRTNGCPPERYLLVLPMNVRSQLPAQAWPDFVRFAPVDGAYFSLNLQAKS